MSDTPWIALGHQAGAVRACAMEGADLRATALRDTEADALGALAFDAQTTIRIGAGEPQGVPCPVLASAGQSLPAVTQDQPADVLGGWARIWIAGYLARHENWDGVICVEEGDVTQWVHVSADEIISFASFLTPRLIRVLGGSEVPDAQAIADSQSRPERLATYLRQAEVTGNAAATTGHLIGAELTAARAYWLGQQLALISPKAGNAPHALALALQDMPFSAHAPNELLEDGLAALAQRFGFAALV